MAYQWHPDVCSSPGLPCMTTHGKQEGFFPNIADKVREAVEGGDHLEFKLPNSHSTQNLPTGALGVWGQEGGAMLHGAVPWADKQTLMWCPCQSSIQPSIQLHLTATAAVYHNRTQTQRERCHLPKEPSNKWQSLYEGTTQAATAYHLTDTSLNLCGVVYRPNAQVPGKWNVREDEGCPTVSKARSPSGRLRWDDSCPSPPPSASTEQPPSFQNPKRELLSMKPLQELVGLCNQLSRRSQGEAYGL